ncbi:hypothetical protein [Pseudolysinimonas sp.]|jgi:hypothetical protein|uniref:hypothetical protein n=1 Tax=Pseudolysinimonas sp. TaxID=2680009 RepID=UPI0037848748
MSVVLPPSPDGTGASGERLTPIVLPAGAPTRSPVLLLGVGIAAIVALLANTVGLVGFPYNAPVEQVYALGINVDLLAIAVVSGIGAYVARRGYPLRAATPITTVAVALVAASAVVWAIAGGLGSIVGLALGSGRYMYASGGLFFGGALWVLAVIFASHGYRRGGSRQNNLIAIVALGVAASLVLYAVVSSVIYGLGLTD